MKKYQILFLVGLLFFTGVITLSANDESKLKRCILGNFDSDSDFTERWTGYYHGNLERSEEHATTGKQTARLWSSEPNPGALWYPGLRARMLVNDWTEYKWLVFDIYNPMEEVVTVTIDLRDDKFGGSQYPHDLVPGANRVKIKIEDIHAAQNEEKEYLDLTRVDYLYFFTSTQEKIELFYDQIYLLADQQGPVIIPELDLSLRQAKDGLAAISDYVENWQKEIKAVSKQYQKGKLSNEELSSTITESDHYTELIEKLLPEFQLHDLRQQAAARFPGSDFAVAIDNTAVHVRREPEHFKSPLTNEVSIELAGHETEGFQLILIPLWRDLKNVTVEVTDLHHAGSDAIISHNNIEHFRVGYIKAGKPNRYDPEYFGWFPDALIPDSGFTVTREDVLQPLWINVYAPGGHSGWKLRRNGDGAG